jgi:glycosyltransferase involved in cell wall biosynthesis
MQTGQMKIFIVIPAYNEQKRIGKLLTQLLETNYPVVVIDDGSRDNTFKIAKKLTPLAFKHRINLGKGAALKTGIEMAIKKGADAVILMDADGQHKIEDLPQFVTALQTKKYDVVIGTRNFSLGVPLVRYLGNKFASVLIRILFGVYVSDLLCGYRAFTKKAYKKILWQSTGYGIETEMITLIGKNKLKFCEVPVETVYFDKFKGVTLFDAFYILTNVIFWRFS